MPHILCLATFALLISFAASSDAVRAAEFGECGGPDRVRLDRAPRLADRRDVIDVDAEFRHPPA